MRTWAIGVVALTLGCAGAAPRPASREAQGERAAIVYELDAQHPFPLPLVRGSVAGKPTRMVVDTGSGATVIAGWLARSLALATTKAGTTHDPSGRSIPMDRCEAANVVIDGFAPLPNGPTPIVELPAEFERAGIGVILSPQALAGSEHTVIVDMPRREIRRVRSSELPPSATPICASAGMGFGNRTLTATASVDGVSTVLEVDTGAFGSPFFVMAETEAGKRLLARPDNVREEGLSAAGGLGVVTASDVPVRLADDEQRAKVTVLPGTRDERCGVEGRLGLERLQACVFTIGERAYHLRCEPKPTSPR